MNVYATVHPQHKDVWEFNSTDDLDPNKSCFVKCTYSPPADSLNSSYSAISFKNDQNAAVTHPHQLYLFIELITTFRVPKKEPQKVLQQTAAIPNKSMKLEKKKLLTDTTRSLLANFNSSIDLSTKLDRGTGKFQPDNSTDFNKTIKSNQLPDNQGNDMNKDDDRLSHDEPITDDEKSDTVELCCGWAMVPIASTLAGSARKLKLPLLGGTPFAVINIPKGEVQQRGGAWNAMKRAFGFETKSTLSLNITPCVGTTATNQVMNSNPNLSSTATALNQFQLVSQPGSNNQMTKSITKEEILNSYRLVSLLPSNIVLPTVGVSAAGIYRVLLHKTKFAYEESKGRVLPQTQIGPSLGHADPILSFFPKLLEDPAASRVLMLLWANEAPDELKTFLNKDITVEKTFTEQSHRAFREVMLRLYRAYNAPDAKHNCMNLEDETAEEINRREIRIKELIGIVNNSNIAPSLVNGGNLMNKSINFGKTWNGANSNANSVDMGSMAARNDKNAPFSKSMTTSLPPKLNQIPLVEHLHTPFNAKELMWKNRHDLGLLGSFQNPL